VICCWDMRTGFPTRNAGKSLRVFHPFRHHLLGFDVS
jgi:hypothetical protein